MLREIDKAEVIDNLRVAVKATLLTVTVHEYRAWGRKYMEHTEPRTEGLEELRDMATDRITDLAGWEPWTNLGRTRDSWAAVQTIFAALDQYGKQDYHNATMYALQAVQRCDIITRRSLKEIVGYLRNLEQSLYGEALTM